MGMIFLGLSSGKVAAKAHATVNSKHCRIVFSICRYAVRNESWMKGTYQKDLHSCVFVIL